MYSKALTKAPQESYELSRGDGRRSGRAALTHCARSVAPLRRQSKGCPVANHLPVEKQVEVLSALDAIQRCVTDTWYDRAPPSIAGIFGELIQSDR